MDYMLVARSKNLQMDLAMNQGPFISWAYRPMRIPQNFATKCPLARGATPF